MPAFYDDLIFPPSISLYSFKGKRQWNTSVVQNLAGYTQRRSQWINSLRTYDAGLVPRPADEWEQIADFFDMVEGQAIGFLLVDQTDHLVPKSNGLLSHISGDVWSFQKVRTVGSHTRYRAIGKLSAATVKLYRTRAGVETVVGGANYTLSPFLGYVTFVAGYTAVGDTYAWSGEFYVPCRFSTDELDWEVVDRQGKVGGKLIMRGSAPITEDRQDGLLFIPPT